MINPFSFHPVIEDYNIIKRYFREYETAHSKSRMRDFRRFARLIADAGYVVAFDFVGSVNFGQADTNSDVDFVLYLACENNYKGECDKTHCQTRYQIENLLMRTLIHEYSTLPYEIQVVDCLNLHLLDQELDRGDPMSPALFRFAFYRSICRCVNARVLKPYQERLMQNPQLVEGLTSELNAVFDGLNRWSPHSLSFSKYRSRLTDLGVRIPDSMLQKIRSHLDFGKDQMGDGI
ncbi:MAG: hypothetical protein KDK37_09870 [Leptospiraceae bacterium]|nr:hypothetical protein [Leptospiraceae bacterium]MCB1304576.1 hypothetical protein [Leptospiraceae bacterium]